MVMIVMIMIIIQGEMILKCILSMTMFLFFLCHDSTLLYTFVALNDKRVFDAV